MEETKQEVTTTEATLQVAPVVESAVSTQSTMVINGADFSRHAPIIVGDTRMERAKFAIARMGDIRRIDNEWTEAHKRRVVCYKAAYLAAIVAERSLFGDKARSSAAMWKDAKEMYAAMGQHPATAALYVANWNRSSVLEANEANKALIPVSPYKEHRDSGYTVYQRIFILCQNTGCDLWAEAEKVLQPADVALLLRSVEEGWIVVNTEGKTVILPSNGFGHPWQLKRNFYLLQAARTPKKQTVEPTSGGHDTNPQTGNTDTSHGPVSASPAEPPAFSPALIDEYLAHPALVSFLVGTDASKETAAKVVDLILYQAGVVESQWKLWEAARDKLAALMASTPRGFMNLADTMAKWDQDHSCKPNMSMLVTRAWDDPHAETWGSDVEG